MQLRAYWVTATITAAFSIGACGFPAIGYNDVTTASSQSSGSSGSGGQGTGADGVGGQGSGGNGGMGGDGGMGGFGPECEYGKEGDCGAGNKCELIDENAGPAGGVECITAGNHPDHAVCETSRDCLDGAYCDRFNQVCQRVCSGGDCDTGQSCRPAISPNGMFSPYVSVCTANCFPESGQPCNQLEGPVNCQLLSNSGWECTKSAAKQEGEICDGADECDVGMGCIGSGMSFFCRYWCTNPEVSGNMNECGVNSACFKLPVPTPQHNGIEYGYCL